MPRNSVIAQRDLPQTPALMRQDTNASAIAENDVYRLYAPANASEALRIESAGDGSAFLSWVPRELAYRDEAGRIDYLYGSAPSSLEVRNREARYRNTFVDADDVYRIETDHVKHYTILREKPRDAAEYLTGRIEFGVSGFISGHPLPPGIHERIETERFVLPEPIVWDGTGARVNGRYEVVDTNEGQYIFVWFDADFLETAMYPVMVDPTVIVNSASQTGSANGEGITGRKLVRLGNGWLVAAVIGSSSGSGSIVWYLSKDSGATWTQYASTGAQVNSTVYLAHRGNTLYTFKVTAGNALVYVPFDMTQPAPSLTATPLQAASMTDVFPGTIAVDANGVLHATWATKAVSATTTSTTGASLNVMYSRSIDNGTTWTPTALTTSNVSGTNNTRPTLALLSDGTPIVLHTTETATAKTLVLKKRNADGTWTSKTVFTHASSVQQAPNMVVDSRDGIHIVWYGSSTAYSYSNIQYLYLSSFAATPPATPEFLTTGNTYHQSNPHLTVDKYDTVAAIWHGSTLMSDGLTYQQVKFATKTATGWSNVIDLTNNIPTSQSYQRYPNVMLPDKDDQYDHLIHYIHQDSLTLVYSTVNLNTTPLTPTGLTRTNFDAHQPATFTSQFNDSDPEDAISAVEAEFYLTSNTSAAAYVLPKTNVTSPAYVIAANTFQNGKTYQYRERHYDKSGTISPWSDWNTFSCSSVPAATIVAPVADEVITRSQYTFTGGYAQTESIPQKSYRFRLYDLTGLVLVKDTGDVFDGLNTFTYSGLTNNASYRIEYSVTSQDGMTTTTGKRLFSVQYTPPMTPLVSAVTAANGASVTVTFSNPAPTAGVPATARNDLYRRKAGAQDWTLVREGVTSPYTDLLAPAGTFEYGVSAVSNEGAVSSIASATVSLVFAGQWLVNKNNPSNGIQFIWNGTGEDIAHNQETALVVSFGGTFERKGPVTYRSGTLHATFLASDGDINDRIDWITAACESDEVFVLKTPSGRLIDVSLSNLRSLSQANATIATVDVDWKEVGAGDRFNRRI